MSAVTWDEIAVLPAPAEVAAGRRGRHLQLVPSPAGGASSATATIAPVNQSGLVLTRAGRLAITVVVILLAVLAAVVGVRSATATPVAAAPAIAATITVAPGETLSGIAARELPGIAIADGIAQIQIANNLSTTAISAGQQLAIPKL